ncbi:MAG TPA: FG-GAP-like repeat-containing protein [bacterium]|nr:FG-GAP-like repeat-containing protein [bacterium]HPN45444.1 FG-GAP-like repeat-containing protein [bacterium]
MIKSLFFTAIISYCLVLILCLPWSLGSQTINTLENTTVGAWDLKFTEPNISGDTQFGNSVASAGDVNGDGYDDFIVAAEWYDSGAGRVFLYYGGARLNTSADVIFKGDGYHELFGSTAAGAGDVNGDGYDDVIIGTEVSNKVYLFFGGQSMDNTEDLILNQIPENCNFSGIVSSAGDVNGDGFADVLAGFTNFVTEKGFVYLYYGGAVMDANEDLVFNGEAIVNNFGSCMAPAGDVNNDGYDDIIIAAADEHTGSGPVYLFFGSAAMNNAADAIMSEAEANNCFGCSIAGIGDVNNDGYADIAIGASGANQQAGIVYLYFGNVNQDAIADLVLPGPDGQIEFGACLTGAGDMNGDGYDDFLVSSMGYYHTGKVNLYLGGDVVDTIADRAVAGQDKLDYYNANLSCAGDINSDGYSDILIGLNLFNTLTGQVRLYYGSDSIELICDLELNGETTNNNFGIRLAGAGDVNGDGYDDVLVGAAHDYPLDLACTRNCADVFMNVTGRVYLYYGGSEMDTQADIILRGEAYSELYVTCIAGVGDVNGDGFDDVIIGDEKINQDTTRLYLFYGGQNMDTAIDLTFTIHSDINAFGIDIARVGDVNGDGFDDVLISFTRYEGTEMAYLYFGGPNMDNIPDLVFSKQEFNNCFANYVAGIDDVNGDGYNDIMVFDCYNAYIYFGGNSMDNIVDIHLIEAYSGLGSTSAGVGDMNGDGYGDVMIINHYKVLIFYGDPAMDTQVDVTLPIPIVWANNDQGSDIVKLNNKNNNLPVTDDYFNSSISSVGDINDDGYTDIAIGYLFDFDPSSYINIHLGGASMDDIVDKKLRGESSGDEYGICVTAAGDVNGDGTSDFIVGAPNSGNTYNGATYLYFGNRKLDINEPATNTMSFPNRTQLQNNYPNPFNPATTIEFELLERAAVDIVIYDISGRTVRILLHESRPGGQHRLTWDGRNDSGAPVGSGVYLCRFSTDKGYSATKRMTLVK